MYKEVLRAINGVEVYPLISLAIFFVFFTLTLIRVVRADKAVMQEMADIPLSDSPETLPIDQTLNR
jgi:cytochrome c oxidase cbb3-type subunit IV